MNPTTWFDALYQCQQQGRSYVLVTVLEVTGSTPREAGSKMLITDDSQFDTIGGGHMEFVVIDKARQFLLANKDDQVIEAYPLASKLGQCCGGSMKVLFEVKVAHSQQVAIFGMGHVAQALVPILAQLPLQIRWVDNRTLSDVQLSAPQRDALPNNVQLFPEDDAIAEMSQLPEGSWAVILTHSHQLDYELVETGLKHGHLGFLGMIGSDRKAQRFQMRLQKRGFTDEQRAQLTSPIGNLAVVGKRPIEVAVSISAQLITLLNHASSLSPNLPSSLLSNLPSHSPKDKAVKHTSVTTKTEVL
ncbi:xanthine dehydrogenase accessory protein XdhC [Marinomonas agarivorans]|nr:xanthine dehydrogenase accessory protein XdhC [Marinomonas agarivorans]